MSSATIQHLKRIPPELVLWPMALLALAIMHPDRPFISFCPLKWLGIPFCPGCGLGRSVSYLLHGDLAASWHTHKFGVLALPILLHRCFSLFIALLKPLKPQYE